MVASHGVVYVHPAGQPLLIAHLLYTVAIVSADSSQFRNLAKRLVRKTNAFDRSEPPKKLSKVPDDTPSPRNPLIMLVDVKYTPSGVH